MKIKSVNLITSNYCNNKCNMCDIWKNTERVELSVYKVKQLFSHSEFDSVEDISISGGEPFMRKDINELIDAVISSSPSLRMLFLNTNGTYPEKVADTVKGMSERIRELYVSVSIEGDRNTHNFIRGVKSYDLGITTIKAVRDLRLSNVKTIISTTLQEKNGDIYILDNLMDLAEQTGSEFSFRFADTSITYYNNVSTSLRLPEKFKKLSIVDKRIVRLGSNVFFDVLREYIATDSIPLMQDPHSGKIKCKAGEIFCFVNYTGEIYPCLYSTRIIGNTQTGITQRIDDLGSKEPCPCATDCHVYPMILYAGGKNNYK